MRYGGPVSREGRKEEGRGGGHVGRERGKKVASVHMHREGEKGSGKRITKERRSEGGSNKGRKEGRKGRDVMYGRGRRRREYQ